MDENIENVTLENKEQLLKKVNEKLFKIVPNQKVNNNIIFIYTPPKVASTTLVSSLRLSLSHHFHILHIHDEEMLSSLIRMNLQGITITDIILYNKELGKNIYVMDVFRDPIERKMSEYFEQLSSLHFNNTEENLLQYPIQKLIERFNHIYLHIAKDDYFREKYNVTVPTFFDFENKYISLIENGIQYIKLRMKDADQWDKILTKIFKREIFLVKEYETKNKCIGDLYKKFKENYRLPYSYFIELNDNSIINYYYQEEEKKEYLDKWSEKIDHSIVQPYSKEEYNLYLKICVENRFYNNTIQTDHYMDNGCLCKYCSFQRNKILKKIKKGENIETEKIAHDLNSIKREFYIQLNERLPKKRIIVSNKKTHNTKIKNTLTSIVYKP